MNYLIRFTALNFMRACGSVRMLTGKAREGVICMGFAVSLHTPCPGSNGNVVQYLTISWFSDCERILASALFREVGREQCFLFLFLYEYFLSVSSWYSSKRFTVATKYSAIPCFRWDPLHSIWIKYRYKALNVTAVTVTTASIRKKRENKWHGESSFDWNNRYPF